MINTSSDPSALIDIGTFDPVLLIEIDLENPLPKFISQNRQSRKYSKAQILVRLHTCPLGTIDINLDEDSINIEYLTSQIWKALHQEIILHLHHDGLIKTISSHLLNPNSCEHSLCLHPRMQLMKEAPFISVIVCTRDRSIQLANCLDSLLALEYPDFEIIVVDNVPVTRSTYDLVHQYKSPRVKIRYVREDRPGLSRARNCGLYHARGEIVAYTDDDAIVDRHWLSAIATAFRATSEVACVTGLTLPAEIETQAQDWFEQFGGHSKGRGFRREILNTQNVKLPIYPIPAYGAGVNMAFRTDILRSLGGFDVALGAGTITYGGEDSAAFASILINGWTLVYEPAALVRHFHRRDYESLCKQLYGYGVAITAYLTKWLIEDPKRIIDILRIVPLALSYFFSPRSQRRKNMRTDYPRELSKLQIRGILYGPVAYVLSRKKQRLYSQFSSSKEK